MSQGQGFRTPPPRPPEEPTALLPPKKRWAWLSRNPTTEADPARPPAVVSLIHATQLAAAAVNPLLAPSAATPAPKSAADASPAAGQKRSSPLQPLAGDHKPDANAPPPLLAADEKPSTPPPPSKRKPKVVRRVRKFAVRTKVVPKETTSGSGAAAAPKETADAAEAAPAAVVAGPLPLPEVAVVEEEGEFVPDEPVAICNNAVAGSQSLLYEETAAAAVAEEETASAGEPPVAEKKLVSNEEGDEETDEPGIFGRQEMKMREVFVGALNRDANEEDVRAGLEPEAAGEITYVRVIMHNKMKKKNRGYCFVRFREPAGATRAIAAAELGDLKICGKPCRIEALDSSKLRIGQGDPFEDYSCIPYREKRPLSTLGGNSSYCMSRNPRARNGSNTYATETSSFGAVPHVIGGYSPLYHHGSIMYLPDSNFYGLAEPWGEILIRQSGSRRPGQPHGSRH